MDYNPVLDALFATWWTSCGAVLLLVALFIVFRKRLFVNRKRKTLLFWVYTVSFLLLFMVVIHVNPQYWGYGEALGAKQAMLKGNQLVVMDYKRVPGGKTTSAYYAYRGQVLDAQTGEKQFRFLVGRNAELLGIFGDEIVFNRGGDVLFFSLKDGSTIAEWTEETLPELFPKLESGVDQMSMDKEMLQVWVTGKDGESWTLDMTDRSFSPRNPNAARILPKSQQMRIDDNKLLAAGPEFQPLLVLAGDDGNDKKKRLITSWSTEPSPFVFLEGELLAVDTVNRCAVVLHYTTTDKTDFILTAVSFDGKKKCWEVTQEALDADVPDDGHVFATFDPGKGLLYLVAADELVTLDMKDGKEKWRVQL